MRGCWSFGGNILAVLSQLQLICLSCRASQRRILVLSISWADLWRIKFSVNFTRNPWHIFTIIVLIPAERDGAYASLGVSGNHTEPEGSCGVLQDGRGGRGWWRPRGDLWLRRCITSGRNHFSLRYRFKFHILLAIGHILGQSYPVFGYTQLLT